MMMSFDSHEDKIKVTDFERLISSWILSSCPYLNTSTVSLVVQPMLCYFGQALMFCHSFMLANRIIRCKETTICTSLARKWQHWPKVITPDLHTGQLHRFAKQVFANVSNITNMRVMEIQY